MKNPLPTHPSSQRRRLPALLAVVTLIALTWAGPLPTRAAEAGPDGAAPWLPLDEEWARLADRLPGFAGWTLGPDGVPEVRMVPQGDEPEGPRALTRRQGQELLRAFGADHRVIPAQFDFRTLYDGKVAARALVALDRSPVRFLDIDEAKNRLVVGVDRAASRATLARLEKDLAALGLPRDAVLLEPGEPLVEELDLRDRVNPSPGGVEVLVGGVCSLGVNVRRSNPSDPSGSGYDTGFVTAGHCTDTAGTVAYQPSGTGSTRVGVVKAYGAAVSAGCPPGETCKYADVLFVDYDTLTYADLGKVARSNTTSPFNILSRSTVTSVLSTPSGGTIRKTGRSTGETTSTVKRSCVDLKFSGGRFYFFCLNSVDGKSGAYSAPGDSGAPVYTDLGSGNVRLHGIHAGGNSSEKYYSPWSNVQTDLGTLLLY